LPVPENDTIGRVQMVGFADSLKVTDLDRWVPPRFKENDSVASGDIETYQAEKEEENSVIITGTPNSSFNRTYQHRLP